MSLYTIYRLECDVCHVVKEGGDFFSRKMARAWMDKNGWLQIWGVHVCPGCKDTKEAQSIKVKMMDMRHPKMWDQVKYFVCLQSVITYSMIETRFNVRYAYTRKIIHALQNEKIISKDFNRRGEYQVLVKIYKADQRDENKTDPPKRCTYIKCNKEPVFMGYCEDHKSVYYATDEET